MEVLKILSASDPADRRTRQSGQFGAEAAGTKYECRVTSQGTESGERVLIVFESKKLTFQKLEELGMRPKIAEQLVELLKRKQGFLLFSSTPGNGLSTLVDVARCASDRFIRNYIAIEDVAKPDRETENVALTTYNATAGESPVSVLPKLIRAYPDVIVVRDMIDAETVTLLCEQATQQERLVISTTRAKEAVEALLRILLLKVPPPEFAAAITAVVNVRAAVQALRKMQGGLYPASRSLAAIGADPGQGQQALSPPHETDRSEASRSEVPAL